MHGQQNIKIYSQSWCKWEWTLACILNTWEGSKGVNKMTKKYWKTRKSIVSLDWQLLASSVYMVQTGRRFYRVVKSSFEHPKVKMSWISQNTGIKIVIARKQKDKAGSSSQTPAICSVRSSSGQEHPHSGKDLARKTNMQLATHERQMAVREQLGAFRMCTFHRKHVSTKIFIVRMFIYRELRCSNAAVNRQLHYLLRYAFHYCHPADSHFKAQTRTVFTQSIHQQMHIF